MRVATSFARQNQPERRVCATREQPVDEQRAESWSPPVADVFWAAIEVEALPVVSLRQRGLCASHKLAHELADGQTIKQLHLAFDKPTSERESIGTKHFHWARERERSAEGSR